MVSSDEIEPKEMMIELQQSHETNSNDIQIHSMSNEGPWTASSTSVDDLYPLIMDSVEALKEIANKLGKKNWNFSVDPCSGESDWANRSKPNGFENAVTCGNCTSDNTTCHVVSIGKTLGLKREGLIHLNIGVRFATRSAEDCKAVLRERKSGNDSKEWREYQCDIVECVRVAVQI
ncbi:putative LRR receptor-like serine/threonine-protein kinase [Camellia lanceoleosa]|uniref:LRR receptor-like serine/threonine-protein kinase n=1 Tax=Camellia lanceoleosa TaxID=1840588 RepID=A0ACC0H1T4_9ERIC|nr:putative LRR receptor-like serine/threonine-protein kinase [Camellia lanceoleosa]